MGGVQGLEGVAADAEAGQAVAVAAQQLQAGEGPEVQLLQPGVPHVQLGDVGQSAGLAHHHALQPVQPGGDTEPGLLTPAQVAGADDDDDVIINGLSSASAKLKADRW